MRRTAECEIAYSAEAITHGPLVRLSADKAPNPAARDAPGRLRGACDADDGAPAARGSPREPVVVMSPARSPLPEARGC